ncbi:MAG: hypothetical protein IKU10_05600, partial [Clostridia bacterium]|nr:hypothetical protein [Clostridia bacterium]
MFTLLFDRSFFIDSTGPTYSSGSPLTFGLCIFLLLIAIAYTFLCKKAKKTISFIMFLLVDIVAVPLIPKVHDIPIVFTAFSTMILVFVLTVMLSKASFRATKRWLVTIFIVHSLLRTYLSLGL